MTVPKYGLTCLSHDRQVRPLYVQFVSRYDENERQIVHKEASICRK